MSGGPNNPGGTLPPDDVPISPPSTGEPVDIPTLVADVQAASDALDDAWGALKDALT